MTGEDVVRLLVVDDHPLVREGLRIVLATAPDIAVVGEACSGLEAVARYRELTPDVVLLDLRLPDADGVEVIVALRSLDPAARIAVLSTYADDEDVRSALGAGAMGYLRKSDAPEEIVAAVRRLGRGARAIAADLLSRAVKGWSVEHLTDRELEVLRLLCAGRRNTEIAESLAISVHTVKAHVSSVLAKLGARDRTQAVLTALERGLVRPRQS